MGYGTVLLPAESKLSRYAAELHGLSPILQLLLAQLANRAGHAISAKCAGMETACLLHPTTELHNCRGAKGWARPLFAQSFTIRMQAAILVGKFAQQGIGRYCITMH